jgi:hypothetical protein
MFSLDSTFYLFPVKYIPANHLSKKSGCIQTIPICFTMSMFILNLFFGPHISERTNFCDALF